MSVLASRSGTSIILIDEIHIIGSSRYIYIGGGLGFGGAGRLGPQAESQVDLGLAPSNKGAAGHLVLLGLGPPPLIRFGPCGL